MNGDEGDCITYKPPARRFGGNTADRSGSGLMMLVLVGAPGSGKSTLCEFLKLHVGWLIISQDKMKTRVACEKAATHALEDKHRRQPVVIDRCNFDRDQRAHWLRIARKARLPKSSIGAVYLDVPTSVCIERVMKRRGHPTLPNTQKSAGIVRDFKSKLVPPTHEEGFGRVWVCTHEADIYRFVSEICNLNDVTSIPPLLEISSDYIEDNTCNTYTTIDSSENSDFVDNTSNYVVQEDEKSTYSIPLSEEEWSKTDPHAESCSTSDTYTDSTISDYCSGKDLGIQQKNQKTSNSTGNLASLAQNRAGPRAVSVSPLIGKWKFLRNGPGENVLRNVPARGDLPKGSEEVSLGTGDLVWRFEELPCGIRERSLGNRERSAGLSPSDGWAIFLDMFDGLIDIETLHNLYEGLNSNLEDAVEAASQQLQAMEQTYVTHGNRGLCTSQGIRASAGFVNFRIFNIIWSRGRSNELLLRFQCAWGWFPTTHLLVLVCVPEYYCQQQWIQY